jgi:hypothetical protein
MYDSDGDDTFEGGPVSPGGNKLSGTTTAGWSFSNTVDGFRYLFGHAENGGTNTADLHDSDSSQDRFVGRPGISKLCGPDFFTCVFGFDAVTGHASDDGFADVAVFFDSDGNDTFHAGPSCPDGTKLEGTTLGGWSFSNLVDGFFYVYGHARLGGDDHAYLYGLDGNLDTFKTSLQDGYSKLLGSTFRSKATGFETVTGRGLKSDGDRVLLFDSAGDDHLEADGSDDPSCAAISCAVQLVEVFDFSTVSATCSMGSDTKHEVPVLDYVLETFGGWIDI